MCQECLNLRLGHMGLLDAFNMLALETTIGDFPTLHIQKFIEDEWAIDYINQYFG